MKILVANPGKQHTHQLVKGLSDFCDTTFATSYWFKPNAFPYKYLNHLPNLIKQKVFFQLKKRSFDPIKDVRTVQYPIPEIKRLILSAFKGGEQDLEAPVFNRDREFDKKVSHLISKEAYNCFIGYEMACLNSFKSQKKKGGKVILDLAQIHYIEIERLSGEFPVFGDIFKDKNLRRRINAVKEEELQLADNVICLSDFAKASLINNGVPKNKVIKLNIGFDPATFTPKASYNLTDKFRFIFVGTITRRKGIDLIIESFKELNLKDTELIFAGPATDGLSLIPKDDERIKYYSYLDQKKLNLLLNTCDVFLFPSYLDSWAMVVVEAMACGLPVIVSKYTGAADAVAQGGGFVIYPSKEELKEKMLYCYSNRDQLQKIGKKAREVAESYTWQNYYKQLKEAFALI